MKRCTMSRGWLSDMAKILERRGTAVPVSAGECVEVALIWRNRTMK